MGSPVIDGDRWESAVLEELLRLRRGAAHPEILRAGWPREARRGQEMPGEARRGQEMPGEGQESAKRGQERPGGARG